MKRKKDIPPALSLVMLTNVRILPLSPLAVVTAVRGTGAWSCSQVMLRGAGGVSTEQARLMLVEITPYLLEGGVDTSEKGRL